MGISATMAMGSASVIHQKTIKRALASTTLVLIASENGFMIVKKVNKSKPIHMKNDFLFLIIAFLLIKGLN